MLSKQSAAAGVALVGAGLYFMNGSLPVDSSITDPEFVSYVNHHGKMYGTPDEFYFRQELYLAKDKLIKEWNSRENLTHTLAHNKFSDWTDDELKKISGMGRRNKVPKSNKKMETKVFDSNDLPDSVDWREKGAVTPVQNQGVCGADWAFATVGVMEGDYFINNKDLIKLSEQ